MFIFVNIAVMTTFKLYLIAVAESDPPIPYSKYIERAGMHAHTLQLRWSLIGLNLQL
jgi:hypothetical protein